MQMKTGKMGKNIFDTNENGKNGISQGNQLRFIFDAMFEIKSLHLGQHWNKWNVSITKMCFYTYFHRPSPLDHAIFAARFFSG